MQDQVKKKCLSIIVIDEPFFSKNLFFSVFVTFQNIGTNSLNILEQIWHFKFPGANFFPVPRLGRLTYLSNSIKKERTQWSEFGWKGKTIRIKLDESNSVTFCHILIYEFKPQDSNPWTFNYEPSVLPLCYRYRPLVFLYKHI